MDPAKVEIRHGKYVDLTGPPRKSAEFTIVPAEIELAGESFSGVCDLKDHIDERSSPAHVRAIVRPGTDAPWVRGRSQLLFGLPNSREEDRCEKTCFQAGFLAIFTERNEKLVGVPFECSDYYGASHLTFSSKRGPPKALQRKIAQAFWDLLLSNPTELVDYSDKMYHTGAGVTIRFGVKDGEPFFVER